MNMTATVWVGIPHGRFGQSPGQQANPARFAGNVSRATRSGWPDHDPVSQSVRPHLDSSTSDGRIQALLAVSSSDGHTLPPGPRLPGLGRWSDGGGYGHGAGGRGGEEPIDDGNIDDA